MISTQSFTGQRDRDGKHIEGYAVAGHHASTKLNAIVLKKNVPIIRLRGGGEEEMKNDPESSPEPLTRHEVITMIARRISVLLQKTCPMMSVQSCYDIHTIILQDDTSLIPFCIVVHVAKSPWQLVLQSQLKKSDVASGLSPTAVILVKHFLSSQVTDKGHL